MSYLHSKSELLQFCGSSPYRQTCPCRVDCGLCPLAGGFHASPHIPRTWGRSPYFAESDGLLTEAFGVSLPGGLRVAFSNTAAEYMDCFNFPKLCTRILALKDPSCLKGVLKAGFCSQASVLLPKIILQDAGKGIVHFL